MLKYEDLLASPISTLIQLYRGLNLEFDITAADTLYNHTRATTASENSNAKDVNGYYSTYRTADNDIFKWKTELSTKKIRHVEQNCVEFMESVGYKVLDEEKITTTTTTITE